MNLTRSILFSLLLLAVTAVAAGAATPEAPPAEPPAVAEAPSDLFGSSVLSQGNCAATSAAGASALAGYCGNCGPVVCRGLPVNEYCGNGAGGPKYCRDYTGSVCSDGNAWCTCTNAIVP